MSDDRRTIEIFSAGCPACEVTIEKVRAASCPSCDVRVSSMQDPKVAARAREIGVTSVPAVAVEGELASCCGTGGPAIEDLREEGLGRPLA